MKSNHTRSRAAKFVSSLMIIAVMSFVIPNAYSYVCMYVSHNGWVGRLTGCHTNTYSISGSYYVGGGYSRSETICTYEAYDPYGVGYEGSQKFNMAMVNQC